MFWRFSDGFRYLMNGWKLWMIYSTTKTNRHFPLQKPGNFIISLRLMSQEFLSFHRKIRPMK